MRNKNSKTQGYGVPFITFKRSMSLQIYKLMEFFFFENRKIAIRRRKNTVWTYLQLRKQKYPKKECIEILSRIDFKVIKMSTYKEKKK